MKDIVQMMYFLGMNISKTADGVWITESSYIYKILEPFNIFNFKLITVPLLPSEDFKMMAFPIYNDLKE